MEHSEHPLVKRRTTVMFSVDLIYEIDRIRAELGVSRSAFLAMAASCFLTKTSNALKPTKREESLIAIERIFTELMIDAREPLPE